MISLDNIKDECSMNNECFVKDDTEYNNNINNDFKCDENVNCNKNINYDENTNCNKDVNYNNSKRILFFGDSNSWGYNYLGNSGFNRLGDERYTRQVYKMLNNGHFQCFEIVEEGLNGRVISSPDKRPGKMGYEYLTACLDSHDTIDYMVVMLGTNDLKDEFNNSANQIAFELEYKIVVPILTHNYYSGKVPHVIIVSPPDVQNTTNSGVYINAIKQNKSAQLVELYKKIAVLNGCSFISANDLPLSADGEHISVSGHKILAQRVCDAILQVNN